MNAISLSAVSDAMIELEDQTNDPRDDVPVGEVMANLLGLPHTPEVDAMLMRETTRARALANAHYARMLKRHPDHPAILGMVAFMQGITLAAAVQKVKNEELS